MEFSLGNDIVSVKRIEESLSSRFIKFVFTKNEIKDIESYARPLLRYAATWAAKEATYKAVKSLYPDVKLGFKDIEINRSNKEPKIILFGNFRGLKTTLTISHEDEYAVANVLAIKGL